MNVKYGFMIVKEHCWRDIYKKLKIKKMKIKIIIYSKPHQRKYQLK